jgi:ATP phosphoribosyltransferase
MSAENIENPWIIAVQKKGKLAGPSAKLLSLMGIGPFDKNGPDIQDFTLPILDMPVRLAAQRDDEIPNLAANNTRCIGIVGFDVLQEASLAARAEEARGLQVIDGSSYPPLQKTSAFENRIRTVFKLDGAIGKMLGFETNCRLVLALPEKDAGRDWREVVSGGCVTSKYAYTAKKFLEKAGLKTIVLGSNDFDIRECLKEAGADVAVRKMAGAVETGPALYGDRAVVELTVSGKTLSDNGLKAPIDVADVEPSLPPVVIMQRQPRREPSLRPDPVWYRLRSELSEIRRGQIGTAMPVPA